jgi:hypothetical protein
LTIDVRLEDVDPLRARLGLAPAGRLTDADYTHWQRCLADAWRLLVARHRPAAETLAAVVEVIVPVEPDPAGRGISATSADAFGAVAMSAPDDGTALALGLLHETQHSLLNAVRYLFDLHTEPDAIGYSPWRDDPRPASGILHGAYAYLAVTRFWRTEAHAGSNAATGRLATFEFARWRAAVAATTGDLLGAGKLTPAGTRFASALADEVRPWLDEPVAPDIARLATGANADHRLLWRLRNLAVDPAAARALAGAWRQSRQPPSDTLDALGARDGLAPPRTAPDDRPSPSDTLDDLPSPADTLDDHPALRDALDSHVRPAPSRALENNNRLNLTHRLLRDGSLPDLGQVGSPSSPNPPRSPTDGDAAHPREDLGQVGSPSSPNPPRSPTDGHAAHPREDLGPLGSPSSPNPPRSRADGDVAYVRGDLRGALVAYRRRVVEQPGDDAAWAGLGLVSGVRALRERPEVVAAVYRALGEGNQDPIALANWISA